MNPEESQRQCAACEELEPAFILTVIKDNVHRRLCTDCLLKEHRDLFCPVCLEVYVAVPPPEAITFCIFCSSISHLRCSPPPPSYSSSSSSSDHFFTCSSCLSPNFSFFSKSLDNDGSEAVLDKEKAKALVAAAEIAVASTKKTAENLKEEAVKKSNEAKEAKEKAKEALVYLENVNEKASENSKAKKRKLQ